MADYNSGLPVRSEADGADERVQIKVVDATNPDTQQMVVDTDSNAHVEAHGNDPAGVDRVIKTSEEGSTDVDGVYDVAGNTEPANIGVVAQERNATSSDTRQTEQITGKRGTVDTTVVAMDISLHDENGNKYDENNPLPVVVQENPGDEIHDFDQAVAIAKDATNDHTYTVVDGKTLLLYGVHGRASGKAKFDLQIGDGAVSETFAGKDVSFNSTANPAADMDFFRIPIKIIGTSDTTTVKLIRTNLDNQAQDLYSTLIGVERDT